MKLNWYYLYEIKSISLSGLKNIHLMKHPISLLLCCFFIINISSNAQDDLKNYKDSPMIKTIEATHFISSDYAFYYKHDSLLNSSRKGLFLTFIQKDQDASLHMHEWNNIFYNDLPHHYFNESKLEQAARILDLKTEDISQIYEFWPNELSSTQYEEIYNAVHIDLVKIYEVSEEMKNKYVITPNPSFWTFRTTFDYPLLVDILSIYERSFEAFELVHDDVESALEYGIIIFDALCNQRNPDNTYFYNQLVLDQSDELPEELQKEIKDKGLDFYDGLPIFNMNSYESDKQEEYKSIISEKSDDLDFVKRVFTKLPNPPFYIIQID